LGSRFPLLMQQLHAGRLEAERAEPALAELNEVARELEQMPKERVVWSLNDLRRRDDQDLPVNRQAGNAYGYFIAPDGQPVVDKLRDALSYAHQRGQAVVLDSRERVVSLRAAFATLVIGIAWAVLAHTFAPDQIIAPLGAQHGVLVWPFGVFLAFVGLVKVMGASYPALAVLAREHPTVRKAASVIAFGLFMWALWR
jgi:hypothetical protein